MTPLAPVLRAPPAACAGAGGISTVAPLDIAALIGPTAWARLPEAVRRRFATGHADAIYAGHLDLDCSALGRCFATLTSLFGGPLTSLRERGITALVKVHDDACGGVVWERLLSPQGSVTPRLVRSTKLPGRNGTLIERTDGGLSMVLDVFEEDGALVFLSRRFFLGIGGLRIPLPAWLTPGVCRVEHRDLGASRFRFTLEMLHPWWGRTFHQTGVFDDPTE